MGSIDWNPAHSPYFAAETSVASSISPILGGAFSGVASIFGGASGGGSSSTPAQATPAPALPSPAPKPLNVAGTRPDWFWPAIIGGIAVLLLIAFFLFRR